MRFKLKLKITEKENDHVIYFINDFGKGSTYKSYYEGETGYLTGIGKNAYQRTIYDRSQVLHYIGTGEFVRIRYNEKHNTYTIWQ